LDSWRNVYCDLLFKSAGYLASEFPRELNEAMEEIGTSFGTAKRVKQDLGIGDFRMDNKVWWSFDAPDDDDEE